MAVLRIRTLWPHGFPINFYVLRTGSKAVFKWQYIGNHTHFLAPIHPHRVECSCGLLSTFHGAHFASKTEFLVAVDEVI